MIETQIELGSQTDDSHRLEFYSRSTEKNVVLVQPPSEGENFEYVAIPRQGLPFLSGALAEHNGPFRYNRKIWLEDRAGKIDPNQGHFDGVNVLMLSCLVNETPRAFEIARLAKEYNPNIKIIAGGPQMGALPQETFEHAPIDVIVPKEGDDLIGDLTDITLTFEGSELYTEFRKLGGVAFMEDGHLVQVPRQAPRGRLVDPNFVRYPDFTSIVGLSNKDPMTAGVVETVRGCVEKCVYCQVKTFFRGYRLTTWETELDRFFQVRNMASQGLIVKLPDGRIPIFISDDLHVPPLRAIGYRDRRLEKSRRLAKAFLERGIDPQKEFFLISQNRAELGQDPEIMDALWNIGMRMFYIGVENSNEENLKLVRKRQDPTQMGRDLARLNEKGFIVVAMTMIGLPFDTEESIKEMAQWVKSVSRFQTANLLTPLPETSNWPVKGDYSPTEATVDEEGVRHEPLRLLNEAGELLNSTGILRPGGELPPYQWYTGGRFLHQDLVEGRGWTMAKSMEIFRRYTADLKRIGEFYRKTHERAQRLAQQTGEAVPHHI